MRRMAQRLTYAVRGAANTSADGGASRRPIRGVIFDMDGTLTLPVLDFGKLRRLLGFEPGEDIIARITKMPVEERPKHLKIVEDFEMDGLRQLQLQPEVHRVLSYLATHNVPRAILTRNAPFAVECFVERLRSTGDFGPSFEEVVTREFTPVKPDPAPIHHICGKWGLAPENVVMVGDFKDDVLCGHNAGAVTVLLSATYNTAYHHMPDMVVSRLVDLVDVFEKGFEVDRPRQLPVV